MNPNEPVAKLSNVYRLSDEALVQYTGRGIMQSPPVELCQNCQRAIEPVDSPGKTYSHRHVASRRICCRSVYEPEIATPASQPTKEN